MPSHKPTQNTSNSEEKKSQTQTRSKGNSSQHSISKAEKDKRPQSQSDQKNSSNSSTQKSNHGPSRVSRVAVVPQSVSRIRYTEPQPLPARENPSRRGYRRSFSEKVGYDDERPRRSHRHIHQSTRAKKMEAYKLGINSSELESDSD